MRHSTSARDTDDTLGTWTYSETIDDETSTIRVRGRVDRLGVDLLRGTIEELDRRGHSEVTVTVERPGSIDPWAALVLAETAAQLGSHHCRLTVTCAADEEKGTAP